MHARKDSRKQCECIDEKGTGHAFAAFLNMQLASTALCVCSCCLLTLCVFACFSSSREDKENSKTCRQIWYEKHFTPLFMEIYSSSQCKPRCCQEMLSQAFWPHNFIPGPCEEYFYDYCSPQSYHTYKQNQDLDKTSHSDPWCCLFNINSNY